MEISKLKSTVTETKNLLEELNRCFKMGKKNSELKDKSMEIIISVKYKMIKVKIYRTSET